MNIDKARQFLIDKGWQKNNDNVGIALFEGITMILAEYEEEIQE
jgi:hypothetical protein